MADDAAEARSPRGRADGEDAGPSEKGLSETAKDDQQQFECQELLECQVELGAPEEEEDAGLVAEAEEVAAGWMLDFLCLSLCRAFRDGRSEDFRRTRDSAEGKCWARLGGRPGPGLKRCPPGGSGEGSSCGGKEAQIERWLESRSPIIGSCFLWGFFFPIPSFSEKK